MADRPSDSDFVITRTFDAPREALFQAWTDAAQLVRWWGPRFFTTRFEGEIRPGGAYRLTMSGPDGIDHPMKGTFLEVVKPERIAYTVDLSEHPDSWHDLVNPNRDRRRGNPAYPSVSTATFEERDDETVLVERTRFESREVRDLFVGIGMREGWAQSLDRLNELISGVKPFVMVRTFDAPRERVFQAWTETGQLKRWWGPKGHRWLEARLDLRPGGLFHYRMRSPDGTDGWGKFVFQEITAPERISFVTSFSNALGETVRAPFNPTWPLEVLATMSFIALDGRTVVLCAATPLHALPGERRTFDDAHASLQQGWSGTFDRLAWHLESVVAG